MQGKVEWIWRASWELLHCEEVPAYFVLSHFPDNCICYTLEVCDNPGSGKSINCILNTLAHSVSLCPTAVILRIVQTFTGKNSEGPDDHWSFFAIKSVWSGQTGWLFSYLCTNPAPPVHPMHPIHPMTGFSLYLSQAPDFIFSFIKQLMRGVSLYCFP